MRYWFITVFLGLLRRLFKKNEKSLKKSCLFQNNVYICKIEYINALWENEIC